MASAIFWTTLSTSSLASGATTVPTIRLTTTAASRPAAAMSTSGSALARKPPAASRKARISSRAASTKAAMAPAQSILLRKAAIWAPIWAQSMPATVSPMALK